MVNKSLNPIRASGITCYWCCEWYRRNDNCWNCSWLLLSGKWTFETCDLHQFGWNHISEIHFDAHASPNCRHNVLGHKQKKIAGSAKWKTYYNGTASPPQAPKNGLFGRKFWFFLLSARITFRLDSVPLPARGKKSGRRRNPHLEAP